MNRLRPLAALLLALLLALTSGTMAVARGQATAVGTLVLCTGQGVVAVPVDAEGKPTGAAHICPDCALSLFAALSAPPPGPVRPAAAVMPVSVASGVSLLPRRPGAAPRARGPPSLS
jgi:hypothetical protein